MDFSECKGYMIPGIDFENGHSIWLLRWHENPTKSDHVTEVWLFHPDGRRVCYIDPGEEIDFFKTYHAFDEVYGADIRVVEEANRIRVDVNDRFHFEVKTGFSLIYSVLNLLLSEKNKIVGKTETGKTTENIPKRVRHIVNASATFNSNDFGKMQRKSKEVYVGDGKASKRPMVCHCTLRLEESSCE